LIRRTVDLLLGDKNHLNKYPLYKAEPDKDEEVLDKVEPNPDEALGVEADQHHGLPPELVREAAEEDAAHLGGFREFRVEEVRIVPRNSTEFLGVWQNFVYVTLNF
jgi:hypothetical protein